MARFAACSLELCGILGVDADVHASLLLDASSENRWPSDHIVMGGLLDAGFEEGLSEEFLPAKKLAVI